MMTTDIRRPRPETVEDLFAKNYSIYSQDMYTVYFLIQLMNLNSVQRYSRIKMESFKILVQTEGIKAHFSLLLNKKKILAYLSSSSYRGCHGVGCMVLA
jgi:hypothetical protein